MALPNATREPPAATLDDPSTPLHRVLGWARDRGARPEFLATLGGHRRWGAELLVREALVRNPVTPTALSLKLAKALPWGSLLLVLRDPAAHPRVQRAAAELLNTRLAALTPGERLTLAREAPADLLPILLRSSRPGADLAALLDNQRLREADLVPAISTVLSRPGLAQVAGHPRWVPRYGVRRALVFNPLTTDELADRLLADLLVQDLRDVARHPRLGEVRRQRAREHLAARQEQALVAAPVPPGGDGKAAGDDGGRR